MFPAHAGISLVELIRFRLPGMTFDDKITPEWFGLEIARLAVDCCFREFAIAHYESEKRYVKQNRFGVKTTQYGSLPLPHMPSL